VDVDERPSPPVPAPKTRPSSSSTAVLAGLVVLGVVLRLVWISRNGPSFDESFTAMAGRRSIGGLFDFLRTSDSHPPLDYLIRLPLARAGADAFLLRAPSLIFSASALALFAWWMRSRGVAGIVAVAVMALSPFQIMYGSEARMYALLELLGVAAAIVGERWLREPRRWHAAVAGGLVLVGVFDHVSGFLLAAGLLALAGRRWDRDAQRWRLWIIGAVALWAVVWGTSFLAQAGTTHASWIDRATLRSVGNGVAALVTNQDGVALVVLAVIVAGVVVTVRSDRVLGRVVLCCGVLPIVAAALIGVFVPFFIDRTLTVAAWAPCLAIGMAADAAWRRSRVAGVAVVLLIGALVVPSTLVFLDRHWEYDASVDHLLTVARPGDVVATIPGWYGPLVDWRVGARAFGAVQPERVAFLPAAHAIRLGDATATGRMWVLSFHGDHRTYPGAARCGRDWDDGVTVVSCLRIPARH
jgi:uncharacterized membrane protein